MRTRLIIRKSSPIPTPGPLTIEGGANETTGRYEACRPFCLCPVRTGGRGFDLMIVRNGRLV